MGKNGKRGLTRFAMTGFTVFLAIWMLAGSASWAPAQTPLNPSGEPGVAPSSKPSTTAKDLLDTTTYIGRSVKQLVKQGYALEGPAEVVAVAGDAIKIFTGKKKDWTLDLKGKTVTVKDSEGKTLLVSDIAKLAKVYIARKQNDVKILVLPKREGRNDS